VRWGGISRGRPSKGGLLRSKKKKRTKLGRTASRVVGERPLSLLFGPRRQGRGIRCSWGEGDGDIYAGGHQRERESLSFKSELLRAGGRKEGKMEDERKARARESSRREGGERQRTLYHYQTTEEGKYV